MKRFLSIMMASVMMFAVICGVDYCSFATLKSQNEGVEWAFAQEGKALDYDDVFGPQCVDLIFYYYEFLGVNVEGGSGSDFIDNSLPNGWERVYDNYMAGDIAVWKVNHACDTCVTGAVGHVGIITEVGTDTFTAVNQNFDGNMFCTVNEFNTSSLACAIRPNWETYSVESIVFSNEMTTNIGKSCATVSFTVENTDMLNVTKVGIRIRQNDSTVWTIKYHMLSDNSSLIEKQYVFDDNEQNFLLSEGKSYIWQAFAEADGKTYYGTTNRFSTVHNEHTPTSSVTKATLTDDGEIVTKCSACGEPILTKTIYAVKTVTLSATSYVYTGSNIKPTVTVKDSKGNVLEKDVDYTVSYPSSKAAGKYTLTVNLIGNYEDTKKLSYTIKPRTEAITLSALAGGFTVKWNKQAEATGYQVQYATKSDFSNAATIYRGATSTTSKAITGRANGTKYYVRVRAYKNIGNGNYVYGSWSPAKSITTPTKPATVSIKSVSGVSKGFTVKWGKVAEATGYQIQYATKSDFSNAISPMYAGATATTSKTITGRGANTKYYVRVRSYKNVNGTYLYGSWSAAKAVTTKK